MTEKLKLQLNESDGCSSYFENLPDELFILIFTKLSSSSSSSNEKKFLDDIKSLGRCSSVSKRFNTLTCLVPALSIKHPNLNTLYKLCPKILKKFRHIRSLQVEYWSCKISQQNPLSFIFWKAAYRPRSYRIIVIACTNIFHYSDDPQKHQSLMLTHNAANDTDFYELTRQHIFNMMDFHHMLVSSIKDHNYLQRVVVTDFHNRGTLTLEEDMLVELRNCTSTNLEQVVAARDRSGSFMNLNVPSVMKPLSRFVKNNFCFSITECWEKDADDHIYRDDDDDDDEGIPKGMHLKYYKLEDLTEILTSVLENPDDGEVNDDKIILKFLKCMKSDRYLL